MTLPVYAIKALVFSGVYLASLHLISSLNFCYLPGFCRVPLPGDHMPGVPPVPIPNTAVKPRAANGSRTLGPARVGCCQVYGPVLRKKNRASFFVPIQGRTTGSRCGSGPGAAGRRIESMQTAQTKRWIDASRFRAIQLHPVVTGAQTNPQAPVQRLTGFLAWDSVARIIRFGPK